MRMIKNYFRIAWRNVVRNKTFSVLNIAGLALGMASSLLMMLWVKDEVSKDAFHAHGDRLYYIYERQYHDGVIDAGYFTPGQLAEEMKTTLPEVEYAANISWTSLETFDGNEKILKKEGLYAGKDFFAMLSYPLLYGDPATALSTPSDIAISKSMAEDFFGSVQQAAGKSIRFHNKYDLRVAAVFDDIKPNSSMQFQYVINWETFLTDNEWAKEWGNNGPSTAFRLREGTDATAFAKKIETFLDLYNKEQSDNFRIKLSMQKYQERYLQSNFKNGEIVGGRIQYVKLFSIVAVFVLLIACINFMNLTSARAIKRAKEIGVRKVVGALRSALIGQFISEALVVVAFAFAFAILVVVAVLPVFNSVTNKQMVLPYTDATFWTVVLTCVGITGLLSGSYPAVYLSSFRPATVLKGSFKSGSGAVWFRKGLVVFQFVLSILLIIGTVVVSLQVNYIQSASLGYDRQDLIYINLEGTLPKQYETFKKQVLASPGVQTVSRISQTPTSIENGTHGVQWEGKDPNSSIMFTQASIGFDFAKAMRVSMAAGRDYSEDFPSDSAAYIVNEAAVKVFGYKDPIGMPLTFWDKQGTIVGVIKDFHFTSLHTAIRPIILRMGEHENWGLALIKTEPGRAKDVLVSLEKICKTLNPAFPFSYQFSDEEYAKMYQSEQVVSKLSRVFAFLAIFIACLGLLGLAMFTTEQRTKEIGIRKVLGASMMSLFGLLSKEILLLVATALVIATPLAWFTMNNWLGEYAYHITLAWWIFIVAGILAVTIALATVSVQTFKALVINPARSLRSE